MGPEEASPSIPVAPSIHEAQRVWNGTGAVRKLNPITEAQAVARRMNGDDVVVCGASATANFWLAHRIESQVGPCVMQMAHRRSAGPQALNHWQQKNATHAGHTFYEQPPTRKAI